MIYTDLNGQIRFEKQLPALVLRNSIEYDKNLSNNPGMSAQLEQMNLLN